MPPNAPSPDKPNTREGPLPSAQSREGGLHAHKYPVKPEPHPAMSARAITFVIRARTNDSSGTAFRFP
ncbi:hypothetical protein SAMN04489729_2010 [Amycolatopsis lurida]|nr:hypothetical protein SAMN04489729_2010 [Amycolatopsis lurida]